jgi:paraquat-inducible protein B
MTTTRQATIVGAFIVGAIVLIAVAIVTFSAPSFLHTPVRAVAFFEGSLAGLDTGAPVTFRGVRVGSVTNVVIRVSAVNAVPTIPVYLELNPGQLVSDRAEFRGISTEDIGELVQHGLRAQLENESLITGQKRVELDFLPDQPAVLVGGDMTVPEIPAIKSQLDELRDELTGLDLKGLTEAAEGALVSIKTLSDRANGEIESLSQSASTITASIDTLLKNANEAVTTLAEEARLTLVSVRRLSDDTDVQINARGLQLTAVLTALQSAAGGINSAASSVGAMLDPRSNLLANLDATMRDLAVAASALRSFALQLERNPSAIILGR